MVAGLSSGVMAITARWSQLDIGALEVDVTVARYAGGRGQEAGVQNRPTEGRLQGNIALPGASMSPVAVLFT